MRPWHWFAVALCALLLVFEIYSGALRGPFLLDDLYLPLGRPDADRIAIQTWLAQRPLLMITFLLNYRLSGVDTWSYHVLNVALHWGVAVLALLLLRTLLGMAGEQARKRDLLALFGAAIFLLHPIQTESVAYVASRSDVLSTLFAYAALLVFFHARKSGISLWASLTVLLLSGCATLSKEQAAVLPVLFVVADLVWSPTGWRRALRRNWKLYIPLVGGGALGIVWILRVLSSAGREIGFRLENLAWHEYFFTQCRVIWLYIRLIVFPYGFNLDHDIAISRGLLDGGAALGMVALMAAVAFAWWRRRFYPLAFFGLLVTLVLLAPTSSFLPIVDLAAERRVYAPLLGLLLIAVDLLRRVRLSTVPAAVLAAGVVAALASFTYARASLYSSDIAIWADAARKSPAKSRPRFQLAYAYYNAGRCPDAVREFATTATLAKPDFRLLVDWALALDCAGSPDAAIARLEQAIALEESAHARSLIGMVYGKQGKWEQALAALDLAERINPAFAMTYVYRGNVLASRGDWARAAEQYRTAVKLEPSNQAALDSLRMAERRMTPSP